MHIIVTIEDYNIRYLRSKIDEDFIKHKGNIIGAGIRGIIPKLGVLKKIRKGIGKAGSIAGGIVSETLIKAGHMALPSNELKGLLEKALENKHLGIGHKCTKFLNKQISKYLISEEAACLYVNKIRFNKEDQKGMSIRIIMDNQFSIDGLFKIIINRVKEDKIERAKRKGYAGLKDEQIRLFNALEDINNEVTEQEKANLIKSILDWSNKNHIHQRIIDKLAKNDKDIKEVVEPLNLKMGNIVIEE